MPEIRDFQGQFVRHVSGAIGVFGVAFEPVIASDEKGEPLQHWSIGRQAYPIRDASELTRISEQEFLWFIQCQLDNARAELALAHNARHAGVLRQIADAQMSIGTLIRDTP